MLRDLLKTRLFGQNRFERCLPHGTYLGKPPEISEISLEGDSLRVCMSSIRTCFGPAGFQQDNETGSRTIAPVGDSIRDTHCNLSRRHVDYGPDSRNGQMSCNSNFKTPRKSGVHCQLPEVSSNTFNHNRISVVSSRLNSKTLTLSLPKETIKKAKYNNFPNRWAT